MALNTGELQFVRETLGMHLPWSPQDYIRELSAGGDRAIYAHQLTSELEAECDLRVIATHDSGQRVMVAAEKLSWDSAFFGYGIAKLAGVFLLDEPYHQTTQDYVTILKPVLATARERGVRYFFATVDPRDLALMRSLGALGFALIETRLHYHMSLQDFQPAERYAVRAATVDDIDYLGKAAQVLVNPFDRFHADPFIACADANRLMYRWVEASIRDRFADITFVPDSANPTAFCTVKYHKDKWPVWRLNLAQPVFSAVSTEYRGWYRRLISEINCHLKDIGAQHVFVTTQITNKAVLRVWESLGFQFGKGEHVFRILL